MPRLLYEHDEHHVIIKSFTRSWNRSASQDICSLPIADLGCNCLASMRKDRVPEDYWLDFGSFWLIRLREWAVLLSSVLQMHAHLHPLYTLAFDALSLELDIFTVIEGIWLSQERIWPRQNKRRCSQTLGECRDIWSKGECLLSKLHAKKSTMTSMVGILQT